MFKKRLTELLQELRDEIHDLAIADTASRENLYELTDRIQARLDDPDRAEQDEGLFEELDESIKYFEASHPTLTKTLNNIMMMLSNMGI